MKGYKIRSKKDGKFTEGGRYARNNFTERGKIWWSLKELLGFLKYYIRDEKKFGYDKNNSSVPIIPDDWEIVEYEFVELSTIKLVKEFAEENKLLP